ncbi:MAG TPA: lipoprotein [Steroidobacteraceae bacterium]|nr:lipoprotein [Steroidobacteraceae bacterium]
MTLGATRSVATSVLALVLAGCGLKGPLELPERATNVVIRGPQQATPEGAGTPPPTGAAPATPTPPKPPAAPAPARDDRQPPPPLPDGNPGSSRGG